MKSIHRVWLGGEMPEEFQENGRLWRELNPDWKLKDWTEEEIMDTEWENQAVLNQMYSESRQPRADMIAYYTHVVDVVDYELVYRHGGLYLNTDVTPLKPLSVLGINEDKAHLAMEDDVHAVNMAMYAPAGHGLFAKIIENLPKRYFGMPGAYMNASTGVQLIMESLGQYKGPVVKWHRDVFNPIHFTDFGYGSKPVIDREYPSRTIAVHGWGHRTNQRGQRILER